MKKLLSIFVLTALFAVNLNAQSTSPRWGSGPPSNDNTGRVLTYAVQSVTTTTATSVAYQKPKAWKTVIKVGTLQHALTDSLSVTNAYLGDEVTFIFKADTLTAGRVVTFGNNIRSAGTLTVPNNKSSHSGQATATFVFDGVYWTEKSRTINTN
jgi:hypothetical protein